LLEAVYEYSSHYSQMQTESNRQDQQNTKKLATKEPQKLVYLNTKSMMKFELLLEASMLRFFEQQSLHLNLVPHDAS